MWSIFTIEWLFASVIYLYIREELFIKFKM